ncbi:hypothetical protein [Thioclava kandeliae]|uniref:Type I-U CRISPR-associated protein Csx17 n=1 Tax=Thioclava kandeliae TaxID=3070818 RepID=A0ABV1SMD8_9RHOB
MSMLMARPLETVPNHALIDVLRGWSMIGTLRFCDAYDETDGHSRPSNGLRVIRRVAAGKYRMDPLRDLHSDGHAAWALQRALRRLEQAYRSSGHHLAQQMGQLALVLEDAETAVEPRHRGQGSRRETIFSHGPHHEVPLDDVVLGLQVEDDLSDDAPAEEWGEARRLRTIRLMPFDTPRSKLSEQLELLDLADRELGLGAEFAALTSAEAKQIAGQALRDAMAGHQGAGLALAAMVSGRSIETLATSGDRPVLGRTWRDAIGGICFAPDVTQAAEGQGKDPRMNGFALHLPVDWGGTAEAACEWLAGLDFSHRATAQRISRALRDALWAQERPDGAAIGLLCGQSCTQTVSLYYARFPVDHLQNIWRDALSGQMGLKTGFRLEALHHRTRHIGSLRGPTLTSVAAWFRGLVRQVEEARRDQSRPGRRIVDLPLLVSAEANLAAQILTFLTARRPHGDAFEPLGQIIGHYRPRVRLTGKGGRQVDDGRWVPLPRAALHAQALWQGSLGRLRQSGLLRSDQALRAMVDAIEAGHAPAFLSWEGIGQAASPLGAADLHLRTGAPASGTGAAAPSNWARHVLRRELAARGLSGVLIDGFMGHGGAAADPLARVSAATQGGQDSLREVLDGIWADLDIVLPAAFVSVPCGMD